MLLPVTGHPLHTRSLTVTVSLREDARWNVRGDIIDLRKCGFVPMQADIQPAGIIHMMNIELVLDPDTLVIAELETGQSVVAIEPSPASKGECCRDPAPRLQTLIGEAIDGAFIKRLTQTFGGALGCSHLLTLFQLMTATIPRARELERTLQESATRHAGERHPGERMFRRSVFIDGHEAEDGSIGLAAQLADFHTRPGPAVEDPFERLASQSDARVFARVSMTGLTIEEIVAAERERTAETLATAQWRDRSEVLEELQGRPIIPGLARRVMGALGGDPADGRLLDALLQIAPGYIQILAAVTDRWFSRRGQGTGPDDAAGVAAEDRPAVAGLGGMPGSCYMWRADGPLLTTRKWLPDQLNSD